MRYFQSSAIQLTLLIKKWKEIKMQRNQSIIILVISFSFYSHLGTNQSKREDNVMLLN